MRRLGCVPVRQRDEVQCNFLLLIGGSMSDAGKGGESQAGARGVARPADKDVQRVLQGTRDAANAQQDGGWTVEARARTVFWPDRAAIPSNHGAWFIGRECAFGCLIGICAADGRRSCYVDTFAGCIPPFCCFSPTRRPSGVGFATTGIAHGGAVSINRSMTGSCCVLGSRPSALDLRGG